MSTTLHETPTRPSSPRPPRRRPVALIVAVAVLVGAAHADQPAAAAQASTAAASTPSEGTSAKLSAMFPPIERPPTAARRIFRCSSSARRSATEIAWE